MVYEKVDSQQIFVCSDDDSNDQIESAFKTWSQHVETAVDRALALQHASDPVKFPRNSHHHSFKGRCEFKQHKKITTVVPVKFDRHGGYTPPSEVYSLKSKLKIRQVRRLLTLQRRIKSSPLFPTDNPREKQSLVDGLLEWQKILRAKGYGSSWKNWLLSFEAIEYIPMHIPDIEQLQIMIDITKMDCNSACYEGRQRAEAFRNKLVIDQQQDFSRMTYKIIKEKNVMSLNEVPVVKKLHMSFFAAVPNKHV